MYKTRNILLNNLELTMAKAKNTSLNMTQSRK